VTMRDLYWRASYWTYSMIYGPGLLMPPFTLKATSGPGFAGSWWNRFSTWWKTQELTNELPIRVLGPPWTRLRSYFHRYRHVGTHRGQGRQSRAMSRILRLETQHRRSTFQAFRDLMDPSTVGVAQFPEPVAVPRAYRKLAWSRLNHEATRIRSRFFTEDTERYDQVP
jgi:hypothetical protein